MNSTSERFDPQELYRSYKRIRNKLRKYEPLSIVEHATKALHMVHGGGIEVLRRYQPWNILLLLKWTYEEAAPLSHRRRPATLNNFHELLNLLHDMEAQVRMPSEYESSDLFVRQLAFQQFSLQHPSDRSALARQEILFSDLPNGHRFQEDFHGLTGLSCKTFTELAFAHFALMLSKPQKNFTRSYFSNLESTMGPDPLDRFWRFTTRTITALHEELSDSSERTRSISDQMILSSPLLDCPMLDLENGSFLIYSPTVLFRSFESAIYRTLRRIDPERFGPSFGVIFEKFVGQCLEDANIHCLSEHQLEELLPGEGKVVDFLIREGNCNILIDAKGVEASVAGRLAHEIQPVFRTVKKSVGKAIHQGQETLDRLRRLAMNNSPALGTGETYLIVVTYETLYLGSGADTSVVFQPHLRLNLEEKFGHPLPIPFRNIFFLSSRELEALLALARSRTTTLVEAFQRAQENDSNPRSRKFTFGLHLESIIPDDRWPETARLPMIERALERLCHRCVSRTGKENSVQ